jgi:hypothetical protein
VTEARAADPPAGKPGKEHAMDPAPDNRSILWFAILGLAFLALVAFYVYEHSVV